MEKDVVLEMQGVALWNAETSLLSALQQEVDAARAQLEAERERTEGEYLNSLGYLLVCWNLSLVLLFSTDEGNGGRESGEGSPPGCVHISAGGL